MAKNSGGATHGSGGRPPRAEPLPRSQKGPLVPGGQEGWGGTETAPCLPFFALGLGLGSSSVNQSGPKAKERRTMPPSRAHH